MIDMRSAMVGDVMMLLVVVMAMNLFSIILLIPTLKHVYFNGANLPPTSTRIITKLKQPK